MMPLLRRGVIGLLAFGLFGCAGGVKDDAFVPLQQAVQARTGASPVWVRSPQEQAQIAIQTDAILAQPLTADGATQLALFLQPDLQADYADLGIAAADVLQAGRLSNPSVQFGFGTNTLGIGLEWSFLDILLRPKRQQLAQSQFAVVQAQVTQRLLEGVLQAQTAYFQAVAARQLTALESHIVRSAQAADDLAEQQFKAGVMSQRTRDAHAVFLLESQRDALLSEQAVQQRLWDLQAALGLTATQMSRLQLPERLPDLPAQLPIEWLDSPRLTALAAEQRADIQAARAQLQAIGQSAQLSQNTAFVQVLNVGLEAEKKRGDATEWRPSIGVELPIFDQGQAKSAAWQARYQQAGQQLLSAVAQSRIQVQQQQLALQVAYQLAAQQRERLQPLRARILQQTGRYYNGMLEGVYDLLADQRAQVDAGKQRVQAEQQYWLAWLGLQQAIGGRLPVAAPVSQDATSIIKGKGHHHE